MNDELNKKKINEIISTTMIFSKVALLIGIAAFLYLLILINKEIKITKFLCVILEVTLPFFIGLFLAYLLNPIVEYLEKKRIKRKFGVCIIYLVMVALLVGICSSIIPSFNSQVSDVVKSLPKIFDKINIFLNNIIHKFEITGINMTDIRINIKSILDEYMMKLSKNISKNCFDLITNIFNSVGIMGLSLIVSFYMLLDFDTIKSNMYIFIPKKYRKNLSKLFESINREFFLFIKGTLIIASIVFVASLIIFSIFGLKAPIFFAFFNAITNIIPYVGPYIGGIPIIIVAFTINYKIGIIITISIVIIQFIEGNVLQPIIMGKTMKLHPVTILISLLIFGYFFGIIGMIFATPIVAIIKTIILFIDNKYKVFNFSKIKTVDGKK